MADSKPPLVLTPGRYPFPFEDGNTAHLCGLMDASNRGVITRPAKSTEVPPSPIAPGTRVIKAGIDPSKPV